MQFKIQEQHFKEVFIKKYKKNNYFKEVMVRIKKNRLVYLIQVHV